MKKTIFYIILSITSILLLGCTIVKEIPVETIIEKEKIVTYRDTVIKTEPDSATMTALLECDSAGNVLLTEIQNMNGKVTKLQYQLSQLKNTNGENKQFILHMSAQVDSLKQELKVKEELIYEHQNKEIVIEVPIPISKWKQFQIDSFWCLIGIILIIATYHIAKLRFK